MKRSINGKKAIRPPGNHPKPVYWESLRAAKLSEQGNACACCPNDINSGYQLELHHRHYENWGNEKPEDVVILCSLCHEYITSRYRILDDYRVEAGTVPPPRPGLPEIEIHAAALPKASPPVARPGLPTAEVKDTKGLVQATGLDKPTRFRPF
jgi:hypothetical protein